MFTKWALAHFFLEQTKKEKNVKYKFNGLTLQYTKGKINRIKTILKSKPIRLIKDVRLDVSQYDLVISDFEPISTKIWSFDTSTTIPLTKSAIFNCFTAIGFDPLDTRKLID